MFDLPAFSEEVDEAVSVENLKAVAAGTADARILLGLAALGKPGSSVRPELTERVVKARTDYGPLSPCSRSPWTASMRLRSPT
jgi:hypothetical protein